MRLPVISHVPSTDYAGGEYDPKKPLDTIPILKAVATFLAGTGALVRPMMDHALAHLEAAAVAIRRLEPVLRRAHLDEFELCIRRALLIMYDEPDQWRIRALRLAMGRLMAVCLPLVLQSPRWADGYSQLWGVLRVRVVVDHKWLAGAGQCPGSDVILAGFEHMDALWVKYRGEGWRPSDDLMFPEREVANLPDPPPVPPPQPSSSFLSPFKSAAGRKNSRAIPIIRPDGTLASIPGKGQGETPEPEAAAQLSQSFAESITTSVTSVDDRFTTDPTTPVALSRPIMPDPNAPPGSAAWWAYISWQPFPSLFPPPFFVRPQSTPSSPRSGMAENLFTDPFLGGPYFAAETSTGEPSESAASEAGSAFGQSSVEERPAAVPAGSSTGDALCSPVTRRASESSAGVVDEQPTAPARPPPDDHLSELCAGFCGPDDDLGPKQEATPRPVLHKRSNGAKEIQEQTAPSPGQPDDQVTPRAPSH